MRTPRARAREALATRLTSTPCTRDRTAARSIADVLAAVTSLLMAPNADQPLVPAIAHQFNTDHAAFVKQATAWTATHATSAS